MEIDKIPQWILALDPEDATFLKNFVLKSGSLKEIARLYEVSYPTVRLRLDKLCLLYTSKKSGKKCIGCPDGCSGCNAKKGDAHCSCSEHKHK